MSWSSNVARVRLADAAKALEEAPVMAPDFGREESLAVAKAAKLLAINALPLVGNDPNMEFSIYVGGHANPGHVKPPEWSADYLQITVTQLLPEEKPAIAE